MEPTYKENPEDAYNSIAEAYEKLRAMNADLVTAEIHHLQALTAAKEGNNLLIKLDLGPVNFHGALDSFDIFPLPRHLMTGVRSSLLRELDQLRQRVTEIDNVARPAIPSSLLNDDD